MEFPFTIWTQSKLFSLTISWSLWMYVAAQRLFPKSVSGAGALLMTVLMLSFLLMMLSSTYTIHSYGLKLLGSTSLSSISNVWAAKADRVVTGRAVEICCHPQVDGCHSGGACGGCSSWLLLVSISCRSWRVSASSLRWFCTGGGGRNNSVF